MSASNDYTIKVEEWAADVIKAQPSTPRERAVRLYASVPNRWSLQVRAPMRRADNREGSAFLIAHAQLSRDHLLELRAAIDVALADLEVG